MKYETYKTLVLSTAHLPEVLASALNDPDTAEELRKAAHYAFIFYPTEYGFRVYADQVPKPMRKAVALAKKLGCRWIEYDCDGPEIEELKTYEW